MEILKKSYRFIIKAMYEMARSKFKEYCLEYTESDSDVQDKYVDRVEEKYKQSTRNIWKDAKTRRVK
jgi:hypothetical protein